MRDFAEKFSKTFQTTNALISVCGFSAGTAILQVASMQEGGNHAAIWVSPTELRKLGEALIATADDYKEDA